MISVITASLPTRSAMLAECVASVRLQTLQPAEHLIGVDFARVGPAVMRSRLLEGVTSEWVAVLDDDDLLYPNHLETLLGASANADVVYSYCEVQGRDWTPNRTFDADALRASNYIPITTLIRTELLRAFGGWSATAKFEDWDLWLRALALGAHFVCVPEVTWRYRFHDGNRTNLGDQAA